MGHHIDSQDRFQSDKNPELPPDKIILSFKDPAAKKALEIFASVTDDKELANDILYRLRSLAENEPHEH